MQIVCSTQSSVRRWGPISYHYLEPHPIKRILQTAREYALGDYGRRPFLVGIRERPCRWGRAGQVVWTGTLPSNQGRLVQNKLDRRPAYGAQPELGADPHR